MKILISGSHGLIGSALIPLLEQEGHTVMRLSRIKDGSPGIVWDPLAEAAHPAPYEGFDAVIHLAGDSIADGRWTQAKKARIRDSRVKGTHQLAQTLSKLQHPPKVLISGSAIGFYGNRGDETLTETSAPGQDFLPDVCKAWEAAAAPAAKKGIRIVHLRTGIVLSPKGGALKKMLLPFKLGVGGILGEGKQWMSWIDLEDMVQGILFVLKNDSVKGPVNFTAPQPVTNADYTQTLGNVLGRPTVLPMPAFAARLAFGEMADALLLASTRVEPTALQKSGFKFRYPQLEGSLRHLLRR